MANRTIADITYLVTHHGADARKLTLEQAKRIYQDTHYKNLYLQYDQPRSNNRDYPDIAYNIIVATDGWEQVREFETYSYHAGNYPVNLAAASIVLTGNYNRDTLSPEMERWYREAVAYTLEKCPYIDKVGGHRTFAQTDCPGDNISDEFIKSVFLGPQPPKEDNSKAIRHLGAALVDIQKAVNELS